MTGKFDLFSPFRYILKGVIFSTENFTRRSAMPQQSLLVESKRNSDAFPFYGYRSAANFNGKPKFEA